MPSSSVREFSDPEDYATALRATTLRLTITQGGVFAGRIVRVDLHDLWMQRFSESLPQIGHSVIVPGRAIISFWSQPGPSQMWNGTEVGSSSLVRHGESEEFYRRSAAASSRASMSLPVERMASVGTAMAGGDLTPPPVPLLVTPSSAAMAKLRRLHAAAGYLAETAPDLLARPEVARGLEQALIEAMVACLRTGSAGEDRGARRHQATIMRRFHRAVEESAGQPLYMPELWAAIGMPDRTLRACCQEYLGMSPKRYLLLRRMDLARLALRRADPTGATVTEIATQFGFWQFGRFAGEYQSLFGELPSATLRRPPE